MTKAKPAEEPVLPAGLVYLGDDSGEPHVDHVPARDLSLADLRRYAGSRDLGDFIRSLVKSGIYAVKES